MKMHQGRQFANRFGGTTTTTLCGRMNKQSRDGMNIAEHDKDVTCKFCIARREQLARRAALQHTGEA